MCIILLITHTYQDWDFSGIILQTHMTLEISIVFYYLLSLCVLGLLFQWICFSTLYAN